jgi:hypothetical protein
LSFHKVWRFNPLPPNVIYICRTALLTSWFCTLNIYSTHVRTEYFNPFAYTYGWESVWATDVLLLVLAFCQ